MATQLKEEALQDIMALPEPERTHRIREWVEEFDVEYGDSVLLKPAKGAGLQVRVGGKKMNFPPRGQLVGRRRALALLRDYGPNGKYVNVDRQTGMTEARLRSLSAEDAKMWNGKSFDFNDNYLIHVPRGQEEEEVEETTENG